MKVNKLNFALITFMLATSSILLADSPTDVNATVKNQQNTKNNFAHRTSGFFLRAGVVLAGGTLSDKYTIKDYNNRIYEYEGTDYYSMTSFGRELSLGGDFTRNGHVGIRVFATVREGTDVIEEFSARHQQLGLSVEKYTGGKNVHFISGISTSYGATDDLDYDDTSLDYIALEPYIGLDFIKSNGFGGFAKFGYEWRFYSLIKDKVGAVSYEDSFEATNLTITTGLQYSF